MVNNIKERIKKIKPCLPAGRLLENDLVIILAFLFIGLTAFGLGRLSALSERKTSVTIEQNTSANLSSAMSDIVSLFVASKNGTKYHYPWCSGAQSIKEENKVWFATKEEAEKAGYAPASNCKGL